MLLVLLRMSKYHCHVHARRCKIMMVHKGLMHAE